MAVALSNLGLVECDQGQYERAVELYEESLALRQKLGDDPLKPKLLRTVRGIGYMLVKEPSRPGD